MDSYLLDYRSNRNLLSMSTPITDQQRRWTIDTLRQAIEVSSTRIVRGANRRQEMHQKVNDNKSPNCHRYRWIQETTREVVAVLQEASRGFNNIYLDDKISVNDLLDVMATVQGFLQGANK